MEILAAHLPTSPHPISCVPTCQVRSSCPTCHSSRLHGHGKTPLGSPRYRCHLCRTVITVNPSRTRPGRNLRREFPHRDNGRICLYLSPSHPYANSGGWQYRYRYRVMCALSRRLHPAEHVDHIDRDLTNDDLTNLRVLLISDHMRYHADLRAGRTPHYIATIAEWDKSSSQFVEYETPRELAPSAC